MASLRSMAACIGLTGEVSLVHDFYGYTRPPRMVADVLAGRAWTQAVEGITEHAEVSDQLSLLQQVHMLQGSYFNINLIRVGIEFFTEADEQDLDAAIQLTRDIYAQVGLGIGRVERWALTAADAKGLENITSYSDAQSLTDDWYVANDGIDVFVVRSFAGVTAGRSAINGSCDKHSKFFMNGSVVTIHKYIGLPNSWTTGLILAHELGHYLGLNHVADNDNLMYKGAFGDFLTDSQGRTMKQHCSVKAGC